MLLVKPPVEVLVRPPRAISRTTRKVGLIGSHMPSLTDCPWKDQSWELWAHASSRSFYKREPDVFFEMHSRERWIRSGKKGSSYFKWLQRNTVPMYMQKRHEDIPAAIEYPLGRVLQEFAQGRPYFTNTIAYMIALALTEGVTHLGLWGVNYSAQSEYGIQRGCAEYWLGRAIQADVHVILPEQCSLLKEPALLYGYESHDEQGILVKEYMPKVFKPAETITPLRPGEKFEKAQPPEWLRKEIEQEEADYPRPEWAKIGA